MNEERPFAITFIGYERVLCAFLLIVSLFSNFTKRFGIEIGLLPVFSEGIMRVLISILLFIIAYGYLRLRRWGYWLMIISNVCFLGLFIILSQQEEQQYLYQNIILLVIELIYILPTRKYFDKKKVENN